MRRDPRASRLRTAGAAILVPTGAVVLLAAASFVGAGWRTSAVTTVCAVVVGVAAGLSVLCLLVARGLEMAAAARSAANLRATQQPPLVPTPPSAPAPVQVVDVVDDVPGEEPLLVVVPAGPLPLRPELLARPGLRRVAAQRQPDPDRVPVT